MAETGITAADPETAGSPTRTGSSARSEASSIDARRWKPRRGLAFVVVATSVLIPFVVAMLTVELATRIVGRPADLLPFLLWLFALLLIATVTMRAVDHLTKRLLPLASMLRLTLVFPDRAPSRFRIALKTGTARSLARAVDAASAHSVFATPQEAAEGVVTLIGAVGRHDRRTLGHCERVRAYTDLIGQQLDLDADSMAKLHWAALLHDVGKLDVPSALLNKKGKPTPAEWLIIRNHPAAADKWLTGLVPWLGEWGKAASEHHERYDGAGYPRGLAGEEISLAGRIVAVADAFDVMTSARSYKKPYPPAQARVELTDNAGSQFDPAIVRAFLAISVGDVRRIIGPISWLATVPELLRVAATSVVEPARTALVATGVAAAGIVPVVASPVQMVTAPTAAIIASAAGAAAGTSALAGDDEPEPRRTETRDSRPATTTTTSAAPVASTTTVAAPTTTVPTTVPATTPATTPTTRPNPTVTPPTTPATTPATTPPTTTPPTSPPTTVAPRPPIANDDAGGSVPVGGRLRIDVLANDSDPDGDLHPSTLRIVSVSPPAYRDDVSVSSNMVDFRPRALYFGSPRIVYEVCDRRGLCDTATVTVTVRP